MEFSIAMLASGGWTNKEIGEHLGISINTVSHPVLARVVIQLLNIAVLHTPRDFLLQRFHRVRRFHGRVLAVFAVNGLLHVAAHGVGRHLVPFFFAVQKRKQRQDNDHQKQNCNKNQRQMFRFLFRNRFKRKTRRALYVCFHKDEIPSV